jgi:hypothetical protein
VIHADDANASCRADHRISSIAAQLQQIDPNVTANITLRSYSTEFANS